MCARSIICTGSKAACAPQILGLAGTRALYSLLAPAAEESATWCLNLTMRVGFSGPARSTIFLARHEHGPARSLLGRAGPKPAPGRAWASPQARWARHGTARNSQPDEARQSARVARW
jgi:hypothetical protein